MKNRIDTLFEQKASEILSVYFTAGYPALQDTVPLLELLSENGVDLVEIGIPFSDPLADGPVIQESSKLALENGMHLQLLFRQLENVRDKVQLPLVLMGYFNTVLQFGLENFCSACKKAGIDGVILPDLPPEVYRDKYRSLFREQGIAVIFLVTPQTDETRIREIDALSEGFIYLVSAAATTGGKNDFSETQLAGFKRIRDMQLRNPLLIGFGIHNAATFRQACTCARGAVVGSAFIRSLAAESNKQKAVADFVAALKQEVVPFDNWQQ